MHKYKGIFNWHGELHTLFTFARSKESALSYFITRLAKILGRRRGLVLNYFLDESKDNWKIVRR